MVAIMTGAVLWRISAKSS